MEQRGPTLPIDARVVLPTTDGGTASADPAWQCRRWDVGGLACSIGMISASSDSSRVNTAFENSQLP